MKFKPKIVISLQVDDKWLSTIMLGSGSPHPFYYSKRMSHGWTSLESGLMLIYSGILIAGYDPDQVWQPLLRTLFHADADPIKDEGDPPF